MANLTDGVALVTGASAGIGEATARALAREGTDLALVARREARLEALAAELEDEHGVRAEPVPADVREEAAVDAAVEETVAAFGRLDVLVNNAGLARGEGEVSELTTEEYRTMMETNVDGVFFATRAALPHLRERDGALVFVGSLAGQYPRPGAPVYAATKWWLRGFAHSVEASEGERLAAAREGDGAAGGGAESGDADGAGVGVSVINPTEVRTEFGSEDGEALEAQFAPGEVTDPEEIADAIVFAARQSNSTVHELDLYRRDKFAGW